jgi:hypothetical protein
MKHWSINGGSWEDSPAEARELEEKKVAIEKVIDANFTHAEIIKLRFMFVCSGGKPMRFDVDGPDDLKARALHAIAGLL